MKKYSLLLIVSALLLFTACLKKEEAPVRINPLVQLGKDTLLIRNFLTLNEINATKLEPTGIYYQIIKPGTGTVTPTSTSKIIVKYKGRFLNGNVFDDSKQDSVTFTLGKLIVGWQLGIPLIKKGGKIRLIISSGYAYQDIINSVIPPNSNLDFDIELIDIK
ncbi:MAG: peptidylprolyl isomerase [Sphingobacteriales bacterium]|jgi:FKBP-type peptidyl-prolyl cis-trans isomerase FkpA|nr:MAG: peptidylprolyl isomerase [Sphingobacteriales bacterium]